MRYFLIGLPGSGKTTLGKGLAAHLNIPFLDTDEAIEKSVGSSVQDIFARFGEEHFRELERQMLKQLITLEHAVISTGGGLPCFYDNMKLMSEMGRTLFLDVPLEVLTDRLMHQKAMHRPMVIGKSREELKAFLAQKREERLPFYSQAHKIFQGSDIQLSELITSL